MTILTLVGLFIIKYSYYIPTLHTIPVGILPNIWFFLLFYEFNFPINIQLYSTAVFKTVCL
jgi:hypothetical protein